MRVNSEVIGVDERVVENALRVDRLERINDLGHDLVFSEDFEKLHIELPHSLSREVHQLAENFEALVERAQFLLAGKTPTPTLASSIVVAEAFIDGRHENMLGVGVCHYHADWIVKPKWARDPRARMVAQRHGHFFYADVP